MQAVRSRRQNLCSVSSGMRRRLSRARSRALYEMPESSGRRALRVPVPCEQIQRKPVEAQRVLAVPRELRRRLQRPGQHDRTQRLSVLSQGRSQRGRFGGKLYNPFIVMKASRLSAFVNHFFSILPLPPSRRDVCTRTRHARTVIITNGSGRWNRAAPLCALWPAKPCAENAIRGA